MQEDAHQEAVRGLQLEAAKQVSKLRQEVEAGARGLAGRAGAWLQACRTVCVCVYNFAGMCLLARQLDMRLCTRKIVFKPSSAWGSPALPSLLAASRACRCPATFSVQPHEYKEFCAVQTSGCA